LLRSLIRYTGLNKASDRSQRSSLIWLAWFSGIFLLTGLLAVAMVLLEPTPAIIAWLVFLLGVAAILYQPRYGIYLILFFGLVGDMILLPWYPFAKNFSSSESLLFISHSIIFSPLEVYIVLTFISWLGRGAYQRKLKVFTGSLFWPALIFVAFIIFGLVYGLATGGNTNIALWEARPIFYLVAMFILVSNLLEKREHISCVLWVAMFALLIVGILGDLHFFLDLKGSLAGVEAITEHGTAVQMNTMFIFAVGAYLYKLSPAKRLALLLMVPIVALTYIATQRRAAFLSLFFALILVAFLLYKENRRVFWLIVPAVTLFAFIYATVFWNSGSKLALPVEAVKSVFIQDKATARDQSSNNYRVIENADVSYTIHAHPLTGVGFGKEFYRPMPLPDISFFVWWHYITHNSILWIWLKTGAFGFLSMIFLVGFSVVMGIQVLSRLPDRNLKAAAFVATFYIIMHFMYAYVDMSWEARSMIYIGTMMGIINCLERVAAMPVLIAPKRWPWQHERDQSEVPGISSERIIEPLSTE
jgi:O-antigen ligase